MIQRLRDHLGVDVPDVYRELGNLAKAFEFAVFLSDKIKDINKYYDDKFPKDISCFSGRLGHRNRKLLKELEKIFASILVHDFTNKMFIQSLRV